MLTSVADPGSGAFLPPGSRIRIREEFFPDPISRIQDLRSRIQRMMFFGEIFLRILVLFLLIKLVPETIRSKKKVGFIFHPSFLCTVGSGIQCFFTPFGSGMKNLGIRDKNIPDPQH
jgi:hypothetical protein